MTKIVILGGGPAGLAAAWWAARAEHEVTLFERGNTTGGMTGSFQIQGMSVDYGSHRLHPTIDPTILADLQTLDGLRLSRRPRNGRIRLTGRWLDFPLRLPNLMRSLPPLMALRMAAETVSAPARRLREDTFSDVARVRLGATTADAFYNPYARKVWGRDGAELAGDQARSRIGATSLFHILRGIARPADTAGWFWYPEKGFGDIAQAIDGAARRAGATILTRQTVQRVDLNAVTVTTDKGAYDTDVVLSTLPLAALPRLVDPYAPDPVHAAAGQLRTRAMVLVYLVIPQQFSTYDAHYLPEPFTPMTRLSEPPNYSGRSGSPSVLCAELPCDLNDHTWLARDDDLAAVVIAGIADMGLQPPTVLATQVRRVPNAYPIITRAAPAAHAVLDEWVATLPSFLSFGRHGLYAHDNTHHALAEARAATDVITESGIHRQAWNDARDRFRMHVVED